MRSSNMQDKISPVEAAMASNGCVTLQDLTAELAALGGKVSKAPSGNALREPRANLRVEVQADGEFYLSFQDRAEELSVTVRLDPAEAATLAAMVLQCADTQIDASCYMQGDLEVT